jgi:ribose transport system substrate-binding protein
MRNRSVLFLVAAAILGAVALTALYWGARLLNPVSGSQRKVIVIFKTIDYRATPFWGNVRDGVVSAGEDFGITPSIRGPAVESNIQGQIDIVRQTIREKPGAIVLAAADYNALVPAAREIKSHRIPLVCVDSFINSDDDDVRIGTDSYEGGQKCAVALLRAVKPGGLVAIMSYVKGSATAIDRESGVRDGLVGKVRTLETLYSNADADLAYARAARLIARTPDLCGIVALNDPTARGAARELIEHHKLPRFINTGSVDISRANMFQPENQKLLFPVAEGP